MEIQEIEVTIDKNGQVQIHVLGAKGTTCLDLTRDLETALGGQVLLRQMTPEAQNELGNPIDQNQQIRSSKG
ncbi:MAG TPA: DUF2997 domain-containing protein [Anaerolineaceae bacterium]|nr:DUF2997 domain-containing protein [Anaerolineaceae bacterium]